MLDWLILGGGIHGVHLAARLIGEGGVFPGSVRIVDPARELLAGWRERAETTGMTHLRSSAVHHLDVHPMSLQRFAGRRRARARGLFMPPFDRPALELFDSHCAHVVKTYGLADLHVRGRARSCIVGPEGARVTVDAPDGPFVIDSRRLVLALGAGEQPLWPDWAPDNHPRVHHVFTPGFDTWPAAHEREVAVVGGGISAGQIALKLVARGHRVHLVSRHPMREHLFDSDTGWFGPKNMVRFHRERDLCRRRQMIHTARHTGSMPPEVHLGLRRAIRRGDVVWHEVDVYAAYASERRVHMHCSGNKSLEISQVLLATGFESRRPGGRLVDELIKSATLPCAPCGYPDIDGALCWHPRVHVMGPLAELELGPTSRNIVGARHAAERLVRVARMERARTLRFVS
ncbi:MAG: FAD/NAD(P)-binding protein [Myxococcota bacterium]